MKEILLALRDILLPFKDPLLVLFGAFLSLLGSFCSLQYQNRLKLKKEDRNLLYEAHKILIKLEPMLGDVQPPPSPEIDELSNELRLTAGKIYLRINRSIAYKLIKFSEKQDEKTKENLYTLEEKIIKKYSTPLYIREREKAKLWEKFRGYFRRRLSKEGKKELKKREKGSKE
jgi:hypothetical protein